MSFSISSPVQSTRTTTPLNGALWTSGSHACIGHIFSLCVADASTTSCAAKQCAQTTRDVTDAPLPVTWMHRCQSPNAHVTLTACSISRHGFGLTSWPACPWTASWCGARPTSIGTILASQFGTHSYGDHGPCHMVAPIDHTIAMHHCNAPLRCGTMYHHHAPACSA